MVFCPQKRTTMLCIHVFKPEEGLGDNDKSEVIYQVCPTKGQFYMGTVCYHQCDEPGHNAELLGISPKGQEASAARKCPGSGVEKEKPLQSLMPLHGHFVVVGHAGNSRELYLDCLLDGMPGQVLVDTGFTISLM